MNQTGSDEQILRQAFYLQIDEHEYLKYYRGEVQWVLVKSRTGQRVRFPANLLQKHVTHRGVEGWFELQYLKSGKALQLVRLSP